MSPTLRNPVYRFPSLFCVGNALKAFVFAALLGGSGIAGAVPAFDLKAETPADTGDMNAGQGYAYTIGALNSGPQPSVPVVVQMILPAGVLYLNGPDPNLSDAGMACQEAQQILSCTVPSLPANVHALATVHVLAPTSAGTIVAPVSLVQQKNDANPQNDSTTTVTTVHAVAAAPDLEITQQDSSDPVLQNAAFTYTLQVRNIGMTPETGQINVYDPLPDGAQFVSASGTDWTCNPTGTNWVRCTRYIGLTAGASAPPIVIAAQNVSATKAIVVNRASVSGSSDTDTHNNLALEQTQLGLTPGVDLAVTQHDDVDPVAIGGTYQYLVTTRNVGDRNASGVTLTDTLPSGSQLVRVTGSGWNCTLNDAVLSCTRDGLASLEASTVAIQLLAPSMAGMVSNSVEIHTQDVDDPSNNQATEQTLVQAQAEAPDLTLTISAPPRVEPNSPFTYSLSVSNVGQYRQSASMTVQDVLPANISLKDIVAPAWNCKVDSNFITCVSNAGVQGGESYPPIDIEVAAPPSPDVLLDTALVYGSADADSSNNFVSVTTTVQANTPPVLADQFFEVGDDQASGFVLGTVHAQDDGLPLPSHLSYSLQDTDAFTIDAASGEITLAQPLDAVVQATYNFTVAAYDGTLATKANVSVHVLDVVTNTPPVLFDQTFSVAEDRAPGSLVGKVLASDDQRPPPGVLSYAIVAGNSGNAFGIDASNGDITVDKALDFETLSSYTLGVQVSDGQLASTASVTISITDVVGGPGLEDSAPVAGDDAVQVAPLGTATTLIGGAISVLANDDDPDAGETATLSVQFVDPPLYGTLSIQLDGTFQYTNTANTDADSFQYQACDVHQRCTPATVHIRIHEGPMDRPPIAVDDAIQVAAEGTATQLTGGLSSVLANDFDLDGDLLKARLLGAPRAGNLTFSNDGGFTYINTDGAAAIDSFVYEACDPFGACTRAIVSITISNGALNHLPLAVADSTISIAPNGSTTLLVGGATTVLQNDSDEDPNEQASLRAVALSTPASGSVTLDGSGSFVYQNTDPSVGHDAFWYEACDIHGACTAAQVSVSIDNTAPAIACQLPTQVFEVGDTISLSIAKLFAPPPGQSLKYSASGLPGSLSVNPDTGAVFGKPGAGEGKLDAYQGVLKATTVPGDAVSSQAVWVFVLPPNELILRNGFDLPPGPCQ